MTEPLWVTNARADIGTKEIPGSRHCPKVLEYWKVGKCGNITDDETPWCATFVSAKLEQSNILSARTAWARGYAKWGDACSPTVGAIVVFERGPNAGHVGFLVGKDSSGNFMILGGNQGDKVKIAPFSRDRVLAVRWPAHVPFPVKPYLPVLQSDGRLSSNEA